MNLSALEREGCCDMPVSGLVDTRRWLTLLCSTSPRHCLGLTCGSTQVHLHALTGAPYWCKLLFLTGSKAGHYFLGWCPVRKVVILSVLLPLLVL